ncbi:MAG: ABC transporter substrate-binding protein [Flavobacteriales bacterium]|nr:ABC transporter substrate-binding protein [Flavobacteriales bacterium]MCB9198240.1 ABC transporter substrate-binding protein [Flavobacteriales bacterium]
MKLFRTLLFTLSIVSLLTSCGGGNGEGENHQEQLKEAEGYYQEGDKKFKIYYGGIFRINEVENFKSLYPHSLIDAVSGRIATQIYQGLYKFDQKTLEPVSCIAESHEVSSDAKVWTFKIRKGIFFQDDECFSGGKGRELNAKDIKFCFDLLCTNYSGNTNYELFTSRVVGARDCYDGKSKEVSGIKVIDDYTLEISLKSPFSGFSSLLAHPACLIFPKEAYDKYGSEGMSKKCVGTGPFVIDEISEGTQVRLKRNPNYWEIDEHGNQLPYLDIVKITFTKDKKSELSNFKKKNLDMIWKLPVDEMETVLASLEDAKKGGNPEFKYQQVNGLNTQFYAFNANSPIFKDIKVRKAFNLAIDRAGLIKYTLKGENEPAEHSLVPKFGNYDNSNVPGFSFDPDQAKKLMAEAGYPNGKGFPALTLYINEGGSINTIVATALQNQLKENIGVSVTIEPLQFDILIERFATGQTDFTRTSWIADFPDASNFLALFYGANVPDDPHAKSLPNFSRYKNPVFDEYLEKGMSAIDEAEQMKYYNMCDSILVADAAFLPLYHDQYIRLVQNNIVAFPINSMEYRDLTRVFKSQ